ncbi:MAG: hypothetical protein R3D67_10665 [Hyphomicrobiaceae bacterium]
MPTSAVKMTTINTAHVAQTRVELNRDIRYAVIERTNDVLNATMTPIWPSHWNVKGRLSDHARAVWQGGGLGWRAKPTSLQSASAPALGTGLQKARCSRLRAIPHCCPYPALAISEWEHIRGDGGSSLGELAARALASG